MKIKNILKLFIPNGLLLLRKYFTINIFNIFRRKFNHYNVKRKSVLIIEYYCNHGETLPGFIKYFLDIGFNVDVLIRKLKKTGKSNQRNDYSLFYCFSNNPKVSIKAMSAFDMNLFFRSRIIYKYCHILINTFQNGMEKDHLFGVDLYKIKPICVVHNYDIKNKYFLTDKIISIVKMNHFTRNQTVAVNPHFFGDYSKKNKSNKTSFVALYSDDISRRNINLLFIACDTLLSKGINNFSVKLLSNKMNISEKYKDIIITYEYLDFENIFNEIYKADFILALMDQASVQYMNKASGTYQLSYGLLKPIILHRMFSEISGFNDKNSILYNDNYNLADAMIQCIKMSEDNYYSLISELEKTQKELYENSLINLKNILS